MPSEVEIGPADGIVADDGHQLLELLAIEQLPLEAACLAYLGPAPRQRELRLAQRHADPVRLVLGRVSEQVVHLRPEALLFEAEGTVDVSGAPPLRPEASHPTMFFSRTSTSTPERASHHPALRPVTPPPMMTTAAPFPCSMSRG